MEWRLPTLLLVVLGCTPAIAAEPGSSFAEFEFQFPQYGDKGGSFRGVALLGEHLTLDAAVDERDHRGGDVGMISLGVGWSLQRIGPMRIVLGLSADVVGGAFGSEDSSQNDRLGINGAMVGAGLNLELAYRFMHRVELLGRAKRTTIGGFPWVTTLGARFYLSESAALAADVQKDDFGYRYGIGLRLDLSRH